MWWRKTQFLQAWGGCQELPGCLVQRVLRAKARCFWSVRKSPSEAVCEITCLERKFLQFTAGSCPSLGWLQLSHPLAIYLFVFFFKSSLMGLGRGRGLVSGRYKRLPIFFASSELRGVTSVRSFPRLLPPAALSRCQPWDRRWGSPETLGARSGQLFPRLRTWLRFTSSQPSWDLPLEMHCSHYPSSQPSSPLAPAAPTWLAVGFSPSPPPPAFLFPFLAKYFRPAQGKSSGFRRRVSYGQECLGTPGFPLGNQMFLQELQL